MKRTKAEMLRIARNRLEGCRGVVRAGKSIRPHVEAVRQEYASANDWAMLDACARVSDQVERWENYGRNVARFERLISHLRGAP